MLEKYEQVVSEAIKIGKAIGDGFAWLFYSPYSDLIFRHANHPVTKHTPRGIGSEGELAFISNVPAMAGYFVLYHGITSILRIGDVTLIDLKSLEIHGIGDLKSHESSPGTLSISLHAVGRTIDLPDRVRSFLDEVAVKGKVQPAVQMPLPLKERLQKQIKRMANAFAPTDTKASIRIEHESKIGCLKTIQNGMAGSKIACASCGDGLLVVGVRAGDSRSLSARLFGTSGGFDGMDLEAFRSDLNGIVDTDQPPGENWNSISVGTVSIAKLHCATPLPLWDLDADFLRQVLFQEVVLVTCYNPSFLVKKLKNEGFTVESTGNENKFRFYKPFLGGRATIDDSDPFVDMITQGFMSSDAVIDTIKDTFSAMVADNVKPNTRVEMRLHRYS
jgi:hypothetical protein